MKDKTKKIKIVVVGDSRVGKTSLKTKYARDRYVEHFSPIVSENEDVDITDGQKVYKATLVDTCTQDDYKRLRPLSYLKADIVLMCFAVDNRTSYENIISEWYPELSYYLPKAPIILVGTKSDLEAKISPDEGEELKQTIKAFYYAECSSKEGTGVKAVFDDAAKAYTNNKLRKKKTQCTIL